MLPCRYFLGVVFLSPQAVLGRHVLEAVHSYPGPSCGDRPLGFFPSHIKRFVAVRIVCISLRSRFIGLFNQMKPAELRISSIAASQWSLRAMSSRLVARFTYPMADKSDSVTAELMLPTDFRVSIGEQAHSFGNGLPRPL